MYIYIYIYIYIYTYIIYVYIYVYELVYEDLKIWYKGFKAARMVHCF